jgi:uncharacterized protein YbjT (DUF2867 family)
MAFVSRHVFLTGGTGYVGTRLIAKLLERGHTVSALSRQRSARALPDGCTPVFGNALDERSFVGAVPPADTYVHLVGVPRPAPWKGEQFRAVDLPAANASIKAAQQAAVGHFIYVSVAQPAPIMKAYIEVRARCEAELRASGVPSTILRPWYILGPGHYWPVLLLPIYMLLESLPSTRESARRLGLVTIKQMIGALVWAVEHPSTDVRIMEVQDIRSIGLSGIQAVHAREKPPIE